MDQTAMLISAVVAMWGLTGLMAKELRTMYTRALDDKDKEIEALKTDARSALAAKDEELKEWRKRAYMVAEHSPPPDTGAKP